MNKEQKPKGKFMRLVTKNYWISAVVCLLLAGAFAQSASPTPGEQQAISGLLLVDITNILALVFVVAGIVRAVRNRKNSK
jgi:uncharacterized membrane protein